MNKKKIQSAISLMLAILFVASSAVIPVFAEENVLLSAPAEPKNNNSVTSSTIEDVREILDSMSYEGYYEKYTVRVEEVDDNGKVISSRREWTVPAAKEAIYVDAIADLYQEGTDAECEVKTFAGVEALYTPDKGKVSWVTSIPETARYSIIIEYYPAKLDENGNETIGKATDIERIFRINSAVPFLEARYLRLPKNYTNSYETATYVLGKGDNADALLSRAAELGIKATKATADDGKSTSIIYEIPEVWTEQVYNHICVELGLRFFDGDIDNNEIRPAIAQSPEWTQYELHDANGYYLESFEFVLEKSDATVLTLQGVNEPMAIKAIHLVPHESYVSYEDARAEYASEAAGVGKVKIEAEYPASTTSQTIYPIEDTRSAINSPNTTKFSMLNSIGGVGGDKWQTSGQKISYNFSVDSTGVYNIVARFSQSALDGMYTSRKLELYAVGYTEESFEKKFGNLNGYYDGVPFAEATKLRFDYSSKWQTKILSDGTNDFEFYFREGVEYKVVLSVTLGSMGDIVNQVETVLESINSDYLSILKLTGAEPDEYRDYGFLRVLPDVVENFSTCSAELTEIAEMLKEMAGVKGSMVATLEQVAWLLDRMGRDPETEIAKNLTQLKSYVGSLGTWISSAKTQPLQLDYLMVQGVGNKLPKAEANFFQAMGYEISCFIQSFFRNYDRMGAQEEIDENDSNLVEVWLASGRDQTQVMRNLVNNEFTPSEDGYPVNLKLVAGGTLLPSILSKRGPDVYIGLGDDDVINYAIRGALMPIEHLDGFDEMVDSQFNEAAMIVLRLADAAGVEHTYGLPETQSFSMMFVRKDILAELGLDIPKTWDDVLSMIPVLQANNMQIGMPSDYKIFLYQQGGDLFADDGMRINLDSGVALDSFDYMCNLFTMYSFPVSYDFANRFRTGEMPVGFAGYTGTYNQLKVFATELEGLWGMYPMPGMLDEEGNINNVAVSGTSAIVMLNGCDNVDGAWSFMKWHSGESFQKQYSNEMVSILGPSAKHPTANIQALESLPWTTDELAEIQLQFNNLASIPNYPGHYIIGRYTNFAFLAAYNDNANPSEELRGYIDDINKEITRKRQEFGLETLDKEGQTLAEKRMGQAYAILADGALEVQESKSWIGENGMNVVETSNVSYKLSSDMRNKVAAAGDKLVVDLGKATDINNKVSVERQEQVLNELISACEELSKSATVSSEDKTGLEKAVKFMNDALVAIESYK